MNPKSNPALTFRDVRVRFNGVVAVDLAQLDLFRGSDLAVFLGPNGAGKSSLINAATGYATVQPPGKVVLENGECFELSTLSRDKIVRAGVARTFQTPVIFPSLTVEESLLIAAAMGKRNSSLRRIVSLFRSLKYDRKSALLVQYLIEELKLGAVAQVRMGELPFVMLRRAELARALAVQPRILFLDEPSAGADESETAFLVNVISSKLHEMIPSLFAKGLYRQSDLAIGLVTHDPTLLDGLAHSCSGEPMTYYFERGQLKSSCPLRQWLKSSKTS
ncbi:MAG: ATP-binding cassette domain-containing protein [Verrucomicrobiales bacterium]|nr:ATP-binding cassette domain-containing protein [Verrucomicrobiales bacterium]